MARTTGSARVGNAMGILTGDLGMIATFQTLANSQLDGPLSRRATAMLSGYAAQTIAGELLDVSHLVEENTDIAAVQLSNHLKTSIYSFTAPLHLGALAADRCDDETMQALADIANPLGKTYQAADDIAGIIGPSKQTGKKAGGDLEAGRRTLLTIRLDTMDLKDAISAVVTEGEGWLNQARQLIDPAPLPEITKHGLSQVTDDVERMLHTYA